MFNLNPVVFSVFSPHSLINRSPFNFNLISEQWKQRLSAILLPLYKLRSSNSFSANPLVRARSTHFSTRRAYHMLTLVSVGRAATTQVPGTARQPRSPYWSSSIPTSLWSKVQVQASDLIERMSGTALSLCFPRVSVRRLCPGPVFSSHCFVWLKVGIWVHSCPGYPPYLQAVGSIWYTAGVFCNHMQSMLHKMPMLPQGSSCLSVNVIRESKGDAWQRFADVTVFRIEKSKLTNTNNRHSN